MKFEGGNGFYRYQAFFGATALEEVSTTLSNLSNKPGLYGSDPDLWKDRESEADYHQGQIAFWNKVKPFIMTQLQAHMAKDQDSRIVLLSYHHRTSECAPYNSLYWVSRKRHHPGAPGLFLMCDFPTMCDGHETLLDPHAVSRDVACRNILVLDHAYLDNIFKKLWHGTSMERSDSTGWSNILARKVGPVCLGS